MFDTGMRSDLLGQIAQSAGFFPTSEIVNLSAVVLQRTGRTTALRAEIAHHLPAWCRAIIV